MSRFHSWLLALAIALAQSVAAEPLRLQEIRVDSFPLGAPGPVVIESLVSQGYKPTAKDMNVYWKRDRPPGDVTLWGDEVVEVSGRQLDIGAREPIKVGQPTGAVSKELKNAGFDIEPPRVGLNNLLAAQVVEGGEYGVLILVEFANGVISRIIAQRVTPEVAKRSLKK
jgi:hypothetical protein